MDNLPKDPPDQNNNSAPASPAGGPPPFGSGFNPHVNPVDPNNPYAAQPPNPPQSLPNGNNNVDPVQSWVAQHEQRDSSGKFVSSEHLKTGY